MSAPATLATPEERKPPLRRRPDHEKAADLSAGGLIQSEKDGAYALSSASSRLSLMWSIRPQALASSALMKWSRSRVFSTSS